MAPSIDNPKVRLEFEACRAGLPPGRQAAVRRGPALPDVRAGDGAEAAFLRRLRRREAEAVEPCRVPPALGDI